MFRAMPFRISSLTHILETPCWLDAISDKVYSPRDVIADKERYSVRLGRIEATELQYPVIMQETGRLFDGHHRVTKATMQGKKEILAYIIPQSIQDLFRVGLYVDRHRLLNDTTFEELDAIYDKNIKRWSQAIGISLVKDDIAGGDI